MTLETQLCLKEFAEKHRVKVLCDSCSEPIIVGKRFAMDLSDRVENRSHIFGYARGIFAVMLLLPSRASWNNARRKLTASGFEVRQSGEAEGTALFDPQNELQSKLAVQIIGAKRRRLVPLERRRVLIDRLSRVRATLPELNAAPVERQLGAQSGPDSSNSGLGPPPPKSPALSLNSESKL
jgi:hypothetical protein